MEALPAASFDALVNETVAKAKVSGEYELDFRNLRALTHLLLAQFHALSGRPFSQDPNEQLLHAVKAVFRSWDAPKAVAYRRLNGLDDAAGTAVTVQAMVFGNASGTSGGGVAFTRIRRPECPSFIWISSSTARVKMSWLAGAICRMPSACARGCRPYGASWAKRTRAGVAVQGCSGFRVHAAVRNAFLTAGAQCQAHALGRAPSQSIWSRKG